MSDTQLLDLLAARATEGLDDVDDRELAVLLDEAPDVRAESLDLAAAELDLGWTEPFEAELPADLRTQVMQDARAHFATSPAALAPKRHRSPPQLSELGWLAIAATVLVAVLIAMQGEAPTSGDKAERAAVLGVSDAVRWAWKPLEDGYRGVTGDVVWSSRLQRGYMRLRGLPINDPQKRQYQLWIVDPQRDKNPVDGGVFDVTAKGEVLIPIDAKLEVGKPGAFAITLEQPGGVVVSGGPLLIVASAS